MNVFTHPLSEKLPAGAAARPVDAALIRRLRDSLRHMLRKGDCLAETFYGLLFEQHPGLRTLFPDDLTQQRTKLLSVLAWVIDHLDRRDKLLPAIADLGRRHVGYGARREHYPVVRDLLVEAMGRTAGRDWDDALAGDWREAIDLIGRHMLAAT